MYEKLSKAVRRISTLIYFILSAHPVHPQPQLTGESHYDVSVTGGNASVGDHCVTNVNPGTPR